jgi:GNAT superfamily N-acetyltransferase
MHKIQVFKSDSELPDKYKWQILSFLRLNWPDGFTGENEERDWINNPIDESMHVIISTEKDVLISYCGVVHKNLEHNGINYVCYGMTGVMCYPPYRGKGYGKMVVEKATEILQQSDADIGMFHCDSDLCEFYKKSGWEPVEVAVTLVGDKNKPEKSEELMMMLFLSDKAKAHKKDFETIPLYFGEDTW